MDSTTPFDGAMSSVDLLDLRIDCTRAEMELPTSPLSSLPPSVASSPLSFLSASPPPPDQLHLPPSALCSGYPSPPASQQTSYPGSPCPESRMGSRKGSTTELEQPHAKRRRISRESSHVSDARLDYVDLRGDHIRSEHELAMQRVLRVLHQCQKIVVIAGAGMSVSAGIPDFRSSTGLFKSLREEHKLRGSGVHLFDASVYKDDTSTSSFHSMVSSMSRLTKDAKPTLFHHMLATLADEGRLLRLYTQNVDGIDTSLEPLTTNVPLRKNGDGKWPRTIQLHGGLDKMVCSKCHELSDFDPTLFSGPIPPACPRCQEVNDIRTVHEGKRSHGIGRLRPRMVLYNEHNPDDEAIGSVTRDDLRKRPDAVIVVGTTLKVPGVRRIVREMCGVVRDRRKGTTIWINNDLPPLSKDLEDCFDVVVQGGCDEVAVRAAMRKWDSPPEPETCPELSEEAVRRAELAKGSVHVTNARPVCSLTHAYVVDLPSKRHMNNSFSPPAECTTPKKVLPRPEWSPMTCRKKSAFCTEDVPAAEGITVAQGLLTPSKSQKNGPAAIFAKLKVDLPKRGPKPGAKARRTNAKSDSKIVPKPRAPRKSKPKTVVTTNTITNTFAMSKGLVSDSAGKKLDIPPLRNINPMKIEHLLLRSDAENHEHPLVWTSVES